MNLRKLNCLHALPKLKTNMPMKTGAAIAVRWFAFALIPGPLVAAAQDKPLWELGAGAAFISFADYRGSDKQRSYLLPLPYFIYRGEFLQVDRDKMRGLFLKTERVELELSANGTVPVRSRDNGARQGMPDLDPTLEIGPSLNVLLASTPQRYRLTLKLPVRAVIASDFRRVQGQGILSQPQLNLDVTLANGWQLGLAGGPLFADRRYHQYFYGVDPVYATAARPAYRARGGYSGLQLVAAASRRFDQLWVGGFVKYDDLSQAVFANSPLFERRNNISAGIAVAWIFAQSRQRVSTNGSTSKPAATNE